jgi:oligopeptide/dipeptide ABC transporter ATP-binding protein
VTDALVVKDLQVHFHTRRGVYKALNGANLNLHRSEVLGVAGESGCGKSTLGLTVMGLLPRNAEIPTGQVILQNMDLVNLQTQYSAQLKGKFSPKRNEKLLKRVNHAMEKLRGYRVSMVFQEPMTSLNPVLQVGFQVAETVFVHSPALLAQRALSRSKATPDDMRQIIRLLQQDGDSGERDVRAYAKEHGLQGIEEQVLFIWQRPDIHVVRKEKTILGMGGEMIRSFPRRVFERVATTGAIPLEMRVTPVLARRVRKILMKEGYRKAEELLTSLGVPHAERVVKMFPHELSGGMRQRVVIAIALANNPEVVIMDEPTSAVDVTVQAQILELVKQIRTAVNATFIVISHDLSVLSEVCDRIAIMYAGRVVEVGAMDKVLANPLHPYTQLLISAIPTLEGNQIAGITGEIPDMRTPPSGCSFHPRCPFAFEKCKTDVPVDLAYEDQRTVACWLYEGK